MRGAVWAHGTLRVNVPAADTPGGGRFPPGAWGIADMPSAQHVTQHQGSPHPEEQTRPEEGGTH